MSVAGTLYEETVQLGFAKLLSVQTAANSASISFVTPFTLGFNTYYWDFAFVRSASNAQSFYINISVDGGSNWNGANWSQYIRAGSHYAGQGIGSIAVGGTGNLALGPAPYADTPLDGRLILNNAVSAPDCPSVTWHTACYYYANFAEFIGSGSGIFSGISGPINGIKFMFDASNIKDGTIRMWGLRKGT